MVIFLATSIATSAQKMSNIDFDEVQTATTDSTSAYYYPKLLGLFLTQSQPMSAEQCTYLYYGSTLFNTGASLRTSRDDKKFYKLYGKKKYQEAMPLGLKSLGIDPLNIRVMRAMAVCCDETGDKAGHDKYTSEANSLLRAIVSSGDGRSENSAYVITKVSDTHAFMEAEGLKPTSIVPLHSGMTVIASVVPMDRTVKKESVKNIYFTFADLITIMYKKLKSYHK